MLKTSSQALWNSLALKLCSEALNILSIERGFSKSYDKYSTKKWTPFEPCFEAYFSKIFDSMKGSSIYLRYVPLFYFLSRLTFFSYFRFIKFFLYLLIYFSLPSFYRFYSWTLVCFLILLTHLMIFYFFDDSFSSDLALFSECVCGLFLLLKILSCFYLNSSFKLRLVFFSPSTLFVFYGLENIFFILMIGCCISWL